MGLREQMNEKPGLVAGCIGGIIVLALIFMLRGGGDSTGTAPEGTTAQAYFTDDDGNTWLADDIDKIPPFDRNGKQAVQAYVYQADGKQFVHYMRRFTPEARKKIEEMKSNPKMQNDPTMMQSIQLSGEEVKARGQQKWIKAGDPKYLEVIRPPANGEMVLPS